MNDAALLELRAVTMRFGGVLAVSNMSFTVAAGAIEGIIGPNGAGKTTILNLITGVYVPTSGDVLFEGRLLTGKAPQRVVRLGIARTFQNIRLFASLTVFEHVLVAQNARMPFVQRLQLLTAHGPQHERGCELLRFAGLWDERERLATTLSYGARRRLEIARALATEPKLLLLDEPVAGMNAGEANDVRDLIFAVRARGITVLLIEHDMPFVMGVCDRLHVLDFGQLIAEGVPADIRRDPAVLRAYLGGADDETLDA